MLTAAFQGFGLGLRPPHYEEIAANAPAVDWFEILSENYMVAGGRPMKWLDRIRSDYPIAMHGVSMSIGSSDPLDTDYLHALKRLADRIEPLWISDHLCWTGVSGANLHDLLPLPYTEATLRHVEDCGLTYLHVFPFSAREKTPAARMPQLPGNVVKDRAARLRKAGEAAVARHLQTLAGATLDVLVEQDVIARAPSFAPVKLNIAATPGSILRARILHTDERFAYAEAA